MLEIEPINGAYPKSSPWFESGPSVWQARVLPLCYLVLVWVGQNYKITSVQMLS